MTGLPQARDLTSLVLRSDFDNDDAWGELTTALNRQGEYSAATCVSDPGYAGVTVERLVELDAGADEEDKVSYLFLADTTTLTDPEQPLVAVDLDDEPGRTFQVPPRAFFDVSANLTIANMDFAEFADAVDGSGMFGASMGTKRKRPPVPANPEQDMQVVAQRTVP